MCDFFKRTWVQINLDAIDYNFNIIKEHLEPQTLVCCVIKADAYGHGAVRIAKEYEKLGADYFAVSNLEEGIQLRNAGIEKPILILGYTPPCCAKELSRLNITQAVFSYEYGEELSNEACKAGVNVRIHIKLDTGMSRIGFLFQNPIRDVSSIDEIEKTYKLPSLDTEGIFTHFSVADEGNDGRAYTLMQFDSFMKGIELLNKRGITFKIRHCANSASIFDYPQIQLDMVRPGIVLYGLNPSDKLKNETELMPAMELKSIVSQVKTVEPQTSISYGRKYISKKTMKIATVPIGYADGYPRHTYIRGTVLIHGKKAKIIGRICMDQLMVNVSSVHDVKSGDTVTLIGRDGDAAITADEIALYNNTINYEIVSMISKRVPRIYYKDGKETEELNYICNSDN
jgi:alanine racemase